jgi:hypothetical protein
MVHKLGDGWVLMVKNDPTEKADHVVTVIAPQSFQEYHLVELRIGSDKFELFAHDNTAWALSSQIDERLVQAMRRGLSVKISANMASGRRVNVEGSLMGFSAALREIDRLAVASRGQAIRVPKIDDSRSAKQTAGTAKQKARTAEQAARATEQTARTTKQTVRTADKSSASGCPMTLAYLDGQLPRYGDPELDSVRRQVLATDLRETLATARAQGFSVSAAARAALQQAEAYEAARPQAEACIRSVSVNPDRIMAELRRGTYNLYDGSINGACAKGYLLYYYGEVANREVAAGLACWARQGG